MQDSDDRPKPKPQSCTLVIAARRTSLYATQRRKRWKNVDREQTKRECKIGILRSDDPTCRHTSS
jgi:hypothetical protein